MSSETSDVMQLVTGEPLDPDDDFLVEKWLAACADQDGWFRCSIKWGPLRCKYSFRHEHTYNGPYRKTLGAAKQDGTRFLNNQTRLSRRK